MDNPKLWRVPDTDEKTMLNARNVRGLDLVSCPAPPYPSSRVPKFAHSWMGASWVWGSKCSVAVKGFLHQPDCFDPHTFAPLTAVEIAMVASIHAVAGIPFSVPNTMMKTPLKSRSGISLLVRCEAHGGCTIGRCPAGVYVS